MREIPLHVSVLLALERRIEKRRAELLEKFAAGVPFDKYERLVGQTQECKRLLEQIEKMRTAIQRDEDSFFDDDDEDEEELIRERTRSKRAATKAR